MTKSNNPGGKTKSDTAHDAKGQYRKLLRKSDSDGVASAKPRVITGSTDATVNKNPPGRKAQKDWDLNYDPGDMNDGKDRG